VSRKYLRSINVDKETVASSSQASTPSNAGNVFKKAEPDYIDRAAVLLAKIFVNSSIPWRFANDPFFVLYDSPNCTEINKKFKNDFYDIITRDLRKNKSFE
jgi:hypothetical protein